MDINYALALYKELEAYLKKYGDQSIVFHYSRLVDGIAVLEADYSDEDKEDCILTLYERLYPGRGGLTDFFIYSEDPEQRKALNEQLSHIQLELWKIVKDKIVEHSSPGKFRHEEAY